MKKRINTISELVDVLAELRDKNPNCWTSCITIYADGSGNFYSGPPEEKNLLMQFRKIQDVSVVRDAIRLTEN